MEFNRFSLTPIVIFNLVIGILFTVAYLYQAFYMIRVIFQGSVRLPEAKKNHRYAFVIAAHNEEAVIGNLVRSIFAQRYPRELMDVFVVCDACTDDTHRVAEEAGAVVWDRNDLARRGKSWALDYAFDRILNDYGDTYEAFVVFDADNVVSPDYISIMNQAFDAGYLVCTGYRNSKNFDSSWISAAYALWFIREAKFLNNARMMSGTSCAISGSGWLVSQKIIRGMHGWGFHSLTEDIQFSTFCSANNVSRRQFASYDLLITVAPGNFLTLLSVSVNLTYLAIGSLSHGFIATQAELNMCVGSVVMTIVSMYMSFFVVGVITTISERRHIHAKNKWRVITNLFTFPIFELSYIPINVVALFKKVEWVPTRHEIAVNVSDIVGDGA